jgi:hypothetical protein
MSAERLSLGEAATRAGQGAIQLFADRRRRAARGRAGVVINLMVENGFRPGAAGSVNRPKSRPSWRHRTASAISPTALPQLDMLIDQTSDLIDVSTTLMSACSDVANRVNALHARGRPGALVAIDRDGAVSHGRRTRPVDPSTTGLTRRAPAGIGLRPFVYLAALNRG